MGFDILRDEWRRPSSTALSLITSELCLRSTGPPPSSGCAHWPRLSLGWTSCAFAHALKLTAPVKGFVAMLLRCDFDHAKRRAYLFADCPQFAKKVVLTRRIVWFVEADGKPKASPSFNHAWFLWDWQHAGPPVVTYGPN